MVWGLTLMLVMPDTIGRQALGEVWDAASALILPATLAVMSASFSTGATAGLRALGLARRSVRAQLFGSAAYVTLGVAGAAIGGAVGSAWGVALATFLAAGVWWWNLRRALPPEPPRHRADRIHARSPQLARP